MLGLALLALLKLFFDVYYFIWTLVCIVKSYCLLYLCGGCLDLFGTLKTWGICTTTDLDYYCHMNNARYLRNADINRLEFVIRTRMLNVIRARGARILLGASTIRYRRPLEAFETYSLHCRILCWDDKAFYMEQRYERCRDQFICAIAILKTTLVGITPGEIAAEVVGKKVESPEFPEEVKAWIESNNISSQKLRKDL